MIDATRRGILRMFGVGASVVATGAAGGVVAATVPTEPSPAVVLDRIARGWDNNPYELTFKPPRGIVYEWKRLFVDTDEPDIEHIISLIANGWKPVPAKRHREHYRDLSRYWIEVGGMVLMEKPAAKIVGPRKHPLPHQAKYRRDA